MDISIVLIVIVVILGLFLITTYNRLVTLRQRVKEAWSDIDIQLKRRHDLIPNLIETVKGYAAHERDARARAAAEDVAEDERERDDEHGEERDEQDGAPAVLRLRGVHRNARDESLTAIAGHRAS